MRLVVPSNKTKGKFKPPRYRAFGFQDGVPFNRPYRTLKGAEQLAFKRGVTHLRIVSIS